ncbi:MAG TPA: hypothetical protein VFE65_27030 [Pseudonocardia sp.]|nr:hypothetical protein [Pseudonocardia sp.]
MSSKRPTAHSMSPQTGRTVSALRELQLTPWQSPGNTGKGGLGSLSAILKDFAPARPMPLIPAQRAGS